MKKKFRSGSHKTEQDIPTNNTPSPLSKKLLTTPTATPSLPQPGGPETSRIHPLGNPPLPSNLSIGRHPVENLSPVDLAIDVDDAD